MESLKTGIQDIAREQDVSSRAISSSKSFGFSGVYKLTWVAQDSQLPKSLIDVVNNQQQLYTPFFWTYIVPPVIFFNAYFLHHRISLDTMMFLGTFIDEKINLKPKNARSNLPGLYSTHSSLKKSWKLLCCPLLVEVYALWSTWLLTIYQYT